jgi:hypothetical protein
MPVWLTWKVFKVGVVGLAFAAVLGAWGADHLVMKYRIKITADQAAYSADKAARRECAASLDKFTQDLNETANTSIAVGDEAAERTKMLAEKMSNAELCRSSQFCRNNKGSVDGGD